MNKPSFYIIGRAGSAKSFLLTNEIIKQFKKKFRKQIIIFKIKIKNLALI